MLSVIRGPLGTLCAICEWWLVDAAGQWTPEGLYVFLHQLERSPGINLHMVRKLLVEQIGRQVPQALGVFWKRKHDKFPRVHAFRREQLVQLKAKEVRV